MTQVKTYPLPPLFLTEVIDKCREQHTHVCDEMCEEDDGYHRYSSKHSCDMEPVIVKIEEGYGRHVHDPDDDIHGCGWRGGDYCDYKGVWHERRVPHTCMRDCDDSDWIVDLQYHTSGYRAVYGVKRAGDIQEVSLWMN